MANFLSPLLGVDHGNHLLFQGIIVLRMLLGQIKFFAMKKHLILVLILLQIIMVQSCLDAFQDHDVDPVEQPYYTLWGQVIDDETDSTVSNAKIIVTMTFSQTGQLYEGGWVNPDTILSDSTGAYSLDSLYLGQYLVEVFRDEELSFSKQIDFFQYADRKYDIVIPAPPDIDFKGLVNRCSTSVKVMKAALILTPIEMEDGAVMDVRETETTDAGRYVFKDVHAGYYMVQGYKGTYKPATLYVTVKDNGNHEFEYDFCMSYISPPGTTH